MRAGDAPWQSWAQTGAAAILGGGTVRFPTGTDVMRALRRLFALALSARSTAGAAAGAIADEAAYAGSRDAATPPSANAVSRVDA